MVSQVFINLVVSDLSKSEALYTAMGFSINPQFSDDSSKCMVWSEHIFLMIMKREKFETFATKPLADTKNGLAGVYALSVESLDKVNNIVNNALSAGGIEPKPMTDHGFMQLRNIEDFDGHTWEIFYMDMTKFPTE